jgi:hypothetical protein
VGCSEPKRIHTQATMRTGAYTCGIKDIREGTVEESHGDLSVS